MRRAGKGSGAAWQAVMLAASVLLMVAFIIFYCFPPPDRTKYTATAPDVDVTLHPGLPQNWFLNAADAAQLDILPGIGEVLSQRIVEERETDGLYFFAEDLMDVKGIGEKTLANILLWLDENPEYRYIWPVNTE